MSSSAQHLAVVTLVADVISAGAIVGSFSGILPPLAALGALLWYAIQVWESDTVQAWIKGHRHVARRKRQRAKGHHVHKHPPHLEA